MAITVIKCRRCTHEWASKNVKAVRVCPRCKSPYWDRDRQDKGNLLNKRKIDVS